MKYTIGIVMLIFMSTFVFAQAPPQQSDFVGSFFSDFIRGARVFVTDIVGSPVDKVSIRLDIQKELQTEKITLQGNSKSTTDIDTKLSNIDDEISQKSLMLNGVEQSQIRAKITARIVEMERLKSSLPPQAAIGLDNAISNFGAHIQRIDNEETNRTGMWALLTADKVTQVCKEKVIVDCKCTLTAETNNTKEFNCASGTTMGSGVCYKDRGICSTSSMGISRDIVISQYMD